MQTHLKKFALAACLAGALSAYASPGAHGPNGEHLDGAATTSASGLARLPDGSVNVPKLAQRRMGIRTVKAEAGEHPVTVELNGRTAIDPNAGGRVQAPFAGRIEAGPQGLPVAGQSVRKGQVLAILRPVASAAERGSQQATLADLRANRSLLEQRVKRLEALEGSVARKDIDAARAELASLLGREKATAAALGGAEPIAAPADGVLASAQVLLGQIVESRDVLFEVVHPDRLLVEASTPDASLAGRIESASVVQADDVQLTLLGGARSLRDGALPVQFAARGKAIPLAVGQPVTVLARLKTTEKGIALPAAALVRNPSNETVVWIKSGAMRFIAQPVEAKALDAHTVVVTKGLSAENRVVVDGAALINQIR
ncbi:MAG TPA: HlyD family efflux transporter periplasmic adaptor subunit [Pseudoduganella sp.]